MKMKNLVMAVVLALSPAFGSAQAGTYSNDEIVIGVLTSFSGASAVSDGDNAVTAAQMAVDEIGGMVNGKRVRVIKADHQNKPDVALTIARKWFDEDGVDVITNLNLSNIALAVMSLAEERSKIALVTSAVSSSITNENCSSMTVHWAHDTFAQTRGLPGAVVKAGGDSWFFISADYTFGQVLQRDATKAILAAGGNVLGSVSHPYQNSDFSSHVLQAQASGAKVIGLANALLDTTASIKQAREFGLTATLVPFFFYQSDAKALGLDLAQGIRTQLAFYWDLNDETRAFAKAFKERTGVMPENTHAAQYTAIQHYLKAVAAAGTDEGKAVRAAMGKLPINDMTTKGGQVRADGRAVLDNYLFEVKAPSESTGEWDILKLVSTPDRASLYRTPAESECPLFKQ